MLSFPWISCWIAIPLSGYLIITLVNLEKERAKLLTMWCMGWCIAFGLYLFKQHAFVKESYEWMNYSCQLSPQAIGVALSISVLLTLAFWIDPHVEASLLFVALLLSIVVSMNWIWLWGLIETFSFMFFGFFALSMHKCVILRSLFLRHVVALICMAFFVSDTYFAAGTFQKVFFISSVSLLWISLFLYIPFWPFYTTSFSFFVEKDNHLISKLILGIVWWIVIVWILSPYAVSPHILSRPVLYGGSALSCVSLLRMGKIKGQAHVGLYWTLINIPVYMIGLNFVSFDKLLLFMMNAGMALIGLHGLSQAYEVRRSFWSVTLLAAIISSMVQQTFFVSFFLPWKIAFLWVGLYGWIAFKCYKHFYEFAPSMVFRIFSLLLILWNLFSLYHYYEFFF